MTIRTKKKKTTNLINIDFIKKAARLLKGEHLEDNEQNIYNLYQKKKKKYNRLNINIWKKNDLWSIDLAEMKDLARYNDNLRYLLCVVDVYSRYAFVRLLQNKSSKNVMKKFEDILLKENEFPKKIVSDEGSEFQGIRKELSKKYNFTIYNTYNREIKATHAERFIRTIKQMIRRTIDLLQTRSEKKNLIIKNTYI